MPASARPRVDGNVPAAPNTDPLGIEANEIADLSASILPLGSDMQDGTSSVSAPEVDLSGLDLARRAVIWVSLKKTRRWKFPTSVICRLLIQSSVD